MPAGAPTKYTPEMCDKVKEFGRQGYHIYQMARELDVSRSVLYDWADTHVEFNDALTRAKQDGIAFWFDVGEKNLNSRDFKEKTYEMLLRHKCRLVTERTVRIWELAKGTHSEQAQRVMLHLESGSLKPSEAKIMMESIGLSAKIDEVTELRKIVERLEKETD